MKPELVEAVHREYMEAGAGAITTNTFAANRMVYPNVAAALIETGWTAAVKAADGRAQVFADIGQVNAEAEVREAEYRWIAERFIALGAKNFIFDTQSCLDGVRETARYIKENVPDAFIIASFSVQDGGFTTEGKFANDLAAEAADEESIDCIGFNCGCSAGHMLNVIEGIDFKGKLLSVMPNAGYPIVVNMRTVYEGDPVYFGDKVADMAALGARILGGCCGTTPAHIRQIVRALEENKNRKIIVKDSVPDIQEEDKGSKFWDKLISGKKPIAVELDPPANADITKFINGVKTLKAAQADIITIADCPIARARMDSSLLACKVYREEGIEAIPHMTCRDRNLNATQALMLGLYAEGIRNILLVTGDPVPKADRDEVKTVYQFNSRKFASFASKLAGQMFPSDVHFFGALNVNARNFDVQIKLAKEKEENGIVGYLTQPVLTERGFENIKKAKEELGGYILGGIIPVVSEKNARFMNSEINGIEVDEKVCGMYSGLEREQAEDLAVEISSEIAKRMEPYVDGFYLITPFQRANLMARIIDKIRN